MARAVPDTIKYAGAAGNREATPSIGLLEDNQYTSSQESLAACLPMCVKRKQENPEINDMVI